MNRRQLEQLGLHDQHACRVALRLVGPAARAGLRKPELRKALAAVIADPAEHIDDEYFGDLAKALLPASHPDSDRKMFEPRLKPAPWQQYGDDLDPNSIEQMVNACHLPVAVAGVLLPDAHLGYGLPIGGVLATDNAVIPYAVGVDIACRMKLTVLDMPTNVLDRKPDQLVQAIETETRFGLGCEFKPKRRQHDVMDENWNVTPITAHFKNKAHAQLGTSGSGNHFVEFGTLTLEQPHGGLEAGTYLALLSHSGSRGVGAQVCAHYSKVAMKTHPNLPKQLHYLAWLDLDTDDGGQYWEAMQLMGRYAAANHDLIHRHIARHLKAKVLLDVENHHNFAWKEEHLIEGQLRSVVVHRKGATPAANGVLGIIPGSMATPGYLVAGKGCPQSLNSAAHGAGRAMSRTKAKQTYRWGQVNDFLKQREVKLISAGLDEVPFAYKDIDTVMAAQTDLVDVLGRFDPRLVKMAPPGERAED
jgi:tRNA-splicing ligase RtcB